MRTTIDLPEALLERVKISAAKEKTTMRELVIRGLEETLDRQDKASEGLNQSAVERLKTGFALGNEPLTREEIHAR